MSLSLPHYILFIMVECWGLYWLVCSHSRISVGATRDPFWVVTVFLEVQPINPKDFSIDFITYYVSFN